MTKGFEGRFDLQFWRIATPRFPEGCDPYNSRDEIAKQDAALLAEMEQCWQKCLVTKPFDVADYILVGAAQYDLCHDLAYKGDLKWYRGHEFLPYG